MAIICRQYGLLFVMTPRTACTAIGELLLTHYDGTYLPADDVIDSEGNIRIQKKHSTLSELIENSSLSKEEAKSLIKFSAVRNPFDTLVSLYFKQRSKYLPLLADPDSWVNRIGPLYVKNMKYAQTHSFKQWLFRKCRRQMLKRFFGAPASMFRDYTGGMDFVIKYENLQNDLREVFRRAGMATNVCVPVINRTDERKNMEYRSYYTPMAAQAVRLAFAEDLKRYGYEF